MGKQISIFWFRRDLRLHDNVGLTEALKGGEKVLPVFIFDEDILDELPEDDSRVTFIFDTLQDIRRELAAHHQSGIAFYHGKPLEVFKNLVAKYNIGSVYTNHDYEPYAIRRDNQIRSFLSGHHINFNCYKDQVIFEKDEVVKADGTPYAVYTPYMRKWKEHFKPALLIVHDTKNLLGNIIKYDKLPNVGLAQMGFKSAGLKVTHYKVVPVLIQQYEDTRNFPSKDSTSRLGPHLRFGTVSIREIVRKAIAEKNEIFWNELIWREFFMQILWHHPHTVNESYKTKYDRIKWRNNEIEFEKWKKGETGFPLVDAGMRQLNKTGFMHNRVRMLVGSFLCKHLLIDWRWGEAYFALKLHDYELSSNIGNWQWVAGSGVDAAPYFRIFNPTSQIEKFDKQHEYINTWVEDLNELSYPAPMVDHKMARERCLRVYKEAVN